MDFSQKSIKLYCSRRRLAAGDGDENTYAKDLIIIEYTKSHFLYRLNPIVKPAVLKGIPRLRETA